MIRPLSLYVLLGASAMAFAQPLYKWVEPDGAITFSVTKPAAGISYETVNPADSPGKAPATSASSNNSAAGHQKIIPASTEPSLEAALPPSTQTNQPAEHIAPQLDSKLNANSVTRSTDTTPADISTAAAKAQAKAKAQASDRTSSVNARTRKQRQCEDLQKRVVSLERRLKTRLTPEDMDNTVVHMARYQRSYDQHCEQ